MQNLSLLKELKRLGGDPRAWVQKHIREGLRNIQLIREDCSGRYTIKDEYSAADMFLGPQLRRATKEGINLAQEFPDLN